MKTAALWLTVGISLSACASMRIGTEEWFNQHPAGKASLSKRASFDMSCPAADLQYVDVGTGPSWTTVGYSTVGVSGCEKKATYIFVNNSKWVLNSQ